MDIKTRIEAFSSLGIVIQKYLSENTQDKYFRILSDASVKANAENPWFSDNFIRLALNAISLNLTKKKLENFIGKNHFSGERRSVAVIMAGNLPLVGFQDFLSVLLSGHKFIGKLSSKDTVLLPAIIEILLDIEPQFSSSIRIEKELIHDFDAVIATGSNNSSRYFDYYFGKYPSIIRRNRSSVAVVIPEDDESVYKEIGKDMLYYFGLGCRSVSKLYVPREFDFIKFLSELDSYKYVADNFKYFNNYEYNKSILLINRIPHYDTGFLLFKEDESMSSPISVVNYEFYDDLEVVERNLNLQQNLLQCVVSSNPLGNSWVKPGFTQFPELNDWADGVDVFNFLGNLK